jgi:acyl-CoA dehydrogenase
MAAALGTLHRFRTTVGAAAVGFAQRALDESVAHVKAREQFGAPLAALQAVQMRIADMTCDVEASRLLVYRAAALADGGGARAAVGRAGSMAKLVATESAQRVIDHAVQLHGGRGVDVSSPVARLYQEIRALRIYEGTTDVQKMLVAREVLGT